MENQNNKLVPLPNPDERQHVPEEHSMIIPLLHLLPIFGQVIAVMMLRCWLNGVDLLSLAGAWLLAFILAVLVLESIFSLNVLVHPYIRQHTVKILYTVGMTLLPTAAVLTALLFPYRDLLQMNAVTCAGMSILLDYLLLYHGALYFRWHG